MTKEQIALTRNYATAPETKVYSKIAKKSLKAGRARRKVEDILEEKELRDSLLLEHSEHIPIIKLKHINKESQWCVYRKKQKALGKYRVEFFLTPKEKIIVKEFLKGIRKA